MITVKATPLDYAPPAGSKIPGRVLAWLPLFLAYGVYVAGDLGVILISVVLLGLVWLAVRRRWWIFAITLFLLPTNFSFARGIMEYSSGTARMEGRGLMRGGYYNPDPLTRCSPMSHGCVVMGGEWMTDGAHNLAVRLMAHFFGPMRGAYDGPYPDRPTVYAALASPAMAINLVDVTVDRIALGSDVVALAPGIGPKLLAQFSAGPATDPANVALVREYGPTRGWVVSGRCVVLAIPTEPSSTVADFPISFQGYVFILLDRATGKPFAYYADHVREFRSRVGYR